MISGQLVAWFIIAYGLVMLIWPGIFTKFFESMSLYSILDTKPVPKEQRKSRLIFWRAGGAVLILVGIYFLVLIRTQQSP